MNKETIKVRFKEEDTLFIEGVDLKDTPMLGKFYEKPGHAFVITEGMVEHLGMDPFEVSYDDTLGSPDYWYRSEDGVHHFGIEEWMIEHLDD